MEMLWGQGWEDVEVLNTGGIGFWTGTPGMRWPYAWAWVIPTKRTEIVISSWSQFAGINALGIRFAEGNVAVSTSKVIAVANQPVLALER